MILSSSQKNAIFDLIPIAKIAINSTELNLPIKPRTHSLLCGPSGVGKSHLMSNIGKKLDTPVLHINALSWSPIGAKGDKATWKIIIEFLDKNNRGIIVLDEIDKIDSESNDYQNFIRLEIFDLLDGKIPHSISIEDSIENDFW